jgi:hypothetical protein
VTSIQKRLLWGIGATICSLALFTQANATLDTSTPVICAFTNGFDCDNRDGCQATSPEIVGLPAFIKLDVGSSKVSVPGAPQSGDRKETAIRGFHEADGKLFLQGIERRGWNAVIDKETGQMTLAASTDNEAIVFFGRCTAP